MPNCFRLYPKGSDQREPAILQQVDEAICAYFGVEVDPKYWVGGWYHCIGFLIALKGLRLGSKALRAEVVKWYAERSFNGGLRNADNRQYLKDQLKILVFLENNYVSDSWVEIGKGN